MRIHRFTTVTMAFLFCALSAASGRTDRSADVGETAEGVASNQGDRQIDLALLNRKFRNSVVRIEFTLVVNVAETKLNPTKSEYYYGAGDEPAHGSGFFISENEIITNAHVVEQARFGSIRIKSPATGNIEFKADVKGVGGSETVDIAVLRLPEDEVMRFKKQSGLKSIPYLALGNSDKVRQSDPVAVFGYPQISDELKVIQAEVTGRQYLGVGFGEFVCRHQFIEVGPAGVVQQGNSGGPALNRDGAVVGIPARGAGYEGQQGWLVPSNIVLHFLERIRRNEAGRQSLRLIDPGLVLAENFAGTAVWAGAPEECVIYELGVVIREVVPNSLIARWKLRPGDIIVGFANRQKQLSCALDFRGYRVVTGRMRDWPPSDRMRPHEYVELSKLHLDEMFVTSDEGDEITLWYLRSAALDSTAARGIQKVTDTADFVEPAPLPHLGTYEKPDFELWGDFVAQDFNDYNTAIYEVPVREIIKGGVLVSFVEPNSLASRRGMSPEYRPPWGFSFFGEGRLQTRWIIIETVNGRPVKKLAELRDALRNAEKVFEAKQKSPDYKPAERVLLKERYVQIGFRTNTSDGSTIRLTPAFPIDEAQECRRSLLSGTQTGPER